MIAQLTLAGTIHAALALACIAAGSTQFLRIKRGAGHRARGYFYVYAMLVADGTALLVYRFTGQFNLFHAAAILNLFCVVMAVVPLLRSPRPSNWRIKHYYWIAWSYVGLIAATATEVVVRAGLVTTRGQGWAVALACSVTVTALGYVIIERNRPIPELEAAAASQMQQDGAPS